MENRFVKISYTARIKGGIVFDTTEKETAVKEQIFDDKRIYRPMPLIVGAMQVIKGLDDALAKMKAGEEKELEIPPEAGYGQRNPDLVRLVPMKAFKERQITPYPGLRIELDGQSARIQTVSGGRVRVDFNSDLAGRTLTYRVKVEEEARKPEDRVKYLIERSFNSSDGFEIKASAKTLDISIPESAYKDRNILVRKASLVSEVFKHTGIEKISFLESWEKKAPAENKKTEKPKKK